MPPSCYLGNVDMQATGKMGLEQLLEDQLKGQPGSLLVRLIPLAKI